MALKCSKENMEKIFVFINIIYFLMTIGLLIVGGLTLSNLAILNTYHVKPVLDAVEVDPFQPGTLATISGVLILVMFGLGLFYAWYQSRNQGNNIVDSFKINQHSLVVVAYVVSVLVMLVIHIVIIELLFTMKGEILKSEMKGKMKANLEKDFKDDTTMNANSVSNAWNYMFMTLDCCAVDPVISTANDFDKTPWCTTSGSCQATSSQIPKTCCKNVDENNYSSAPSGCHASVNSGSYNSKGCYDALKDKLLSQIPSITDVVITTMIMEVLVVICTFLFYRSQNDN